jgi:RNA polymerase sigma-70 factor (ECF subfamily)
MGTGDRSERGFSAPVAYHLETRHSRAHGVILNKKTQRSGLEDKNQDLILGFEVESRPILPLVIGRLSAMVSPHSDITLLLSELSRGNQAAGEALVPLVYEELKRLARSYMRKERPGHTLQTTALVHEAYVKLVSQRAANWQGRSHFFAISAQVMRRILIDHARSRLRKKRGGPQEAVALDEALVFSPERSEELVKLDEALERLAKLDARQSRIVELRFFGGLSVEETSECLGVSAKTVKRDWSVAKAWLHGELRRMDGDVPRAMGTR